MKQNISIRTYACHIYFSCLISSSRLRIFNSLLIILCVQFIRGVSRNKTLKYITFATILLSVTFNQFAEPCVSTGTTASLYDNLAVFLVNSHLLMICWYCRTCAEIMQFVGHILIKAVRNTVKWLKCAISHTLENLAIYFYLLSFGISS
jgi:hypothetical protein